MADVQQQIDTKFVEYSPTTGELMTLQMGPQHPSTHGVLRLEVDLDGERVVDLRPVVGYLHRAKEKLAEVKTYHQWIPYTDRMDYTAPMSNNTGYVMAVEKLLDVEITDRCRYLRTLICELQRIAAHLVWLGSTGLELGAASVFLYCFRERERILNLFEWIAGARFTVSYMRVGGVARDATDEWLAKAKIFVDDFPSKWEDYNRLLTENEIFVQRTKGVGHLSAEDCVRYGLTGPLLRASGNPYDLRKDEPYLAYPELDWEVAWGTEGDVYERYLVRMREMYESCRIAKQCLEKMPGGPVNIDNPKVIFPPRERVKKGMEDLIHHFMLAAEGFTPPEGEVYFAIEAPKGELGFYIVSDGSPHPYRLKVRSPSFTNLQGLKPMAVGEYFADLIATVSSIDFIMGEVDR
jgi:NADH-quinone oxidoreductase subunit D